MAAPAHSTTTPEIPALSRRAALFGAVAAPALALPARAEESPFESAYAEFRRLETALDAAWQAESLALESYDERERPVFVLGTDAGDWEKDFGDRFLRCCISSENVAKLRAMVAAPRCADPDESLIVEQRRRDAARTLVKIEGYLDHDRRARAACGLDRAEARRKAADAAALKQGEIIVGMEAKTLREFAIQAAAVVFAVEGFEHFVERLAGTVVMAKSLSP